MPPTFSSLADAAPRAFPRPYASSKGTTYSRHATLLNLLIPPEHCCQAWTREYVEVATKLPRLRR